MQKKNNPITLCVICNAASQMDKASEFSTLHQYPLCDQENAPYDLQLIFDDDKTKLIDKALNTSIYVDFIEGTLAHREKHGGGKGQAIAKAIGLKKLKNPTVIDATAGLAGDAYVLACLGCQLTLIEQSPVLFTLIEDGIKRALLSENHEHSIGNFVNLVNSNSQLYLKGLDEQSKPDVIYIDPMYPDRKKSALVKKDMQILHKLIGKAEDETDLVNLALECAKRRVVVKRPIHAEPITGTRPTMEITSKKTRYDVYVIS